MKKVKVVNGLVIARWFNKSDAASGYQIFTKEEYAYGQGYRSQEWETSTLEEAIEWAKGWKA